MNTLEDGHPTRLEMERDSLFEIDCFEVILVSHRLGDVIGQSDITMMDLSDRISLEWDSLFVNVDVRRRANGRGQGFIVVIVMVDGVV